MPKALLGNAAFEMVAGSELVLLDVAEYLIGRGWQCDITAFFSGDPVRRLAKRAGARIVPRPAQIRPLEYDLVWLQNRMEGVFDYSRAEIEADRTLFVFSHLDAKWSFAQPGVVLERVLGGLFVVTSERAVDRVVSAGLSRPLVRMFRNAAPVAFSRPGGRPRTVLRNLVVVSNHAPEEVQAALALLREQGIETRHFGTGGDVQGHRVAPSDLDATDAVITIGKTVPAALRARVPVYLYDHFGGPGWLNNVNLLKARERNFSGLCCERRLTAEAIAEEVVTGFMSAAVQSAAWSEDVLTPFRLEPFMEAVVNMVDHAPTPDDHRSAMAEWQVQIAAERELQKSAGHYFGAYMRGRPKPQAPKIT